MEDLNDLYILSEEHPRFNFNKIIEEREILVIINKMELLLFTNKGDFIDNDFGCDIPTQLWKTRVDNATLLNNINKQFNTYIPELSNYIWKVELDFVEGVYDDILVINIYIEDYNIKTTFQ